MVQRDWTVACDGHWYQLDRQHEALSLAGRKVVVRTLRDGRVQLVYRGRKLRWRELPTRPQPAPRPPNAHPRGSAVPGVNHPWRRWGVAAGRNSHRGGARAGGGTLPPAPPPARTNGNTNRNNYRKKGTFLTS